MNIEARAVKILGRETESLYHYDIRYAMPSVLRDLNTKSGETIRPSFRNCTGFLPVVLAIQFEQYK